MHITYQVVDGKFIIIIKIFIITNAKRLCITQKIRFYVLNLYHGSEYKCMKLWFSYLLLLLSLWLLSLFCPVGMATKSSPCCYQSKPIGAQCVSVDVCVVSCGNENCSLELCGMKTMLLCIQYVSAVLHVRLHDTDSRRTWREKWLSTQS